MASFSSFKQSLKNLSSASVPLILDPGSAFTKVRGVDQKIHTFPSIAIKHRQSGLSLDFSSRKKSLAEDQSQLVEKILPIQRGVVSDIEVMTEFCQACLSSSQGSQDKSWWRPTKGIWITPSQLTAVELYLCQKVQHSLGGSWEMIPKSAVWQNIFSNHSQWKGYGGSIDLGAETTEVVVLGKNGQTHAQTIHRGIKDLEELVRNVVRVEYGCELSDSALHFLNVELDSQVLDQAGKIGKRVTVRGKQIQSGQPVTITVEYQKIKHVYQEFFSDWVEMISNFLTHLNAGEITKTLEQGIVLSGGGSLLPGLDSYLSGQLAVEIKVSKKGDLDLVQGIF